MRNLIHGAGGRSIGLALAALAAVAALAVVWRARMPGPPPGSTPAERTNVLLVTIDTLRDDRVGSALTPALSSLAARGVRFTQARTVAPLTLPAHASLMTGLLPPHSGVRLNGAHRLDGSVPTLATMLRAAGYATGAVVGAYVLDRRFGLASGFDTYDDEIVRREENVGLLETERRGDVVADRATAWIRARPGGQVPFFLWVHLYDPHAPYTPPAEWLARARGQAYDGEVAYADAQLGRIVDALRSLGLLDRTLIVVAGDHGESLGEHGEATHGMLVYEAAIRVPLVVSGPGLTPQARSGNASLVDVLPTVLRRVGVPPPPGLDGRDLFDASAPAGDAESYVETQYPESAACSPLQALVSDRWKFIGGPPDPELFDLQADPGEARNEASARRPLVDAMASRVAAIRQRAKISDAGAPSPEVVERLRALGYVAAAPAAQAGGRRPSPATIIKAWGRLEEAVSDLAAGRRDRGLATLAALSRERPDAAVFQSSYGRALVDSARAREAVDVYRAALRRWPQDTDLLHGLAVAARDAGRPAEAMRAEEAVLAIDDRHAAAHNGLGLLHADAGRHQDARADFERAIDLDPYAVPYRFNLGNARLAGGDVAGAEAAYREALRLDPGSEDGANGLGVVLVQTGRAADAVPIFERVLAASPDFYDAWLNLGIANQGLGRRDRAADAYRRVLAAPPKYARQRRAAADLLASLGGAR